MAGFLVTAVPAQAAVTGASITPTDWVTGTSNAATLSWTESAVPSTIMVRSPWPWPASYPAGTTGSPVTETATIVSTTVVECATTGIRFTSAQFNVTGAPTCNYVNAPGSYWTGFYLSGGTLGMVSAPTITVTVPSGLVTAPSSARTDTWIVGPYSLSWNSSTQVEVTTRAVSAGSAPQGDPAFAPQPPTNVTAVKEFDANLDMEVIRVSWDAPADQGTLPVTHYAVYGGPNWGAPQYAAQNAGCLNDSTAKVFTSCVVSSQNLGYGPQLGPNVFFVKAFNGLGWSGAGSSNMLDIQPDVNPPSAPRNVKAVGGWNKVTVTWEKPEKRGGYPITNYLASSDPGRKYCITTAMSYSAQRVDDNALTCEFKDLTPGKNYTFSAQALNGNGWGAQSAMSNAATPWNLKTSGYSRKWTFLKLNQEITVKGVGPGLPVGHKIGVEWRFPKGSSQGEWRNAGTVSNGAGGTFSWTQKMPKFADRKAPVAVRFFSLDPVTGERHDSNSVLIEPVK